MYSFDTFCFTKWGKAMLKFSLMLPYSWNNDPRCFHSEAYSLIINHWQRTSPRYRTMVSVSVSRLKVRSVHPYVKPLSGFMSTVFDQVLTVNSIHLCCDLPSFANTSFFFMPMMPLSISLWKLLKSGHTFIWEKCHSLWKFYTNDKRHNKKKHNKCNDRDAP